ncbi:hypothetical protein [Arthrobacter sp. Br18]|uniref:hypothetical protein n=1 Tax=Arthrobacter sp. Br18 TaxID=1312954 RepID=UPI00047A35E9|nr:hypothetical protein [Arthrobacter sp. Br18]
MTEQNLPDEELTIVDEDPEVASASLAPEAFDPVLEGNPDDYAEAAENNPDRWQEDPLLQDEPAADLTGEEGYFSDQTLREETAEARYEQGEEQIPPDEPMLGEAAADVDFGMMEENDVDASDDPANRGGSPLSHLDQEDVR